MAVLTEVLHFEREVTGCFKLDDNAIAIVQGPEVMICSPFQANRPLGGMHNTYFNRGRDNVVLVANVLLDTRLIVQVISENGQEVPGYFSGGPACPGIVLVTSLGQFIIIDTGRQAVVSEFIPDFSKESILDVCGSKKNAHEVCVLTKKRAYIIEIGCDKCEIVATADAHGTAIYAFGDGYLISCENANKLWKKSSNLVDFCEAGEIRVEDDLVVICKQTKGQKVVSLQVICGKEFTIARLAEGMWDVACGCIIAFHDGEFLSLCRTNGEGNRLTISLESGQDVGWIFGNMNGDGTGITVILVNQRDAPVIYVPFPE
jgi:hypothetical protein